MKELHKQAATSVVIRFKLYDSITLAEKTGLTNASAGLSISAIASNESATTTYTGANINSITTLGTYAAPGAGKCNFKKVDDTNHPGVCELQLEDSRFSVSGAKKLLVTIFATGVKQQDFEIQLASVDLYDAVHFGLSALPNVASGSAGAIPTTGSGANQIAVNGSGKISGVVLTDSCTTVTNLTNAPASGDLTATMKTSVTTAATSATPTVTAGTVSDKTGYALSASYDLYHCDIEYTRATSTSTDEYTITFFKNGVRQTSGITVPTIEVVKRADGTDLIAQTSLTQIASTGSYKHDETANRLTPPAIGLVIVTATVNGTAMTFSRLIGRDG